MSDRRVDEALTRLGHEFCRSVRALGHAGDPATANRCAASAWWAVRDVAPSVASHINGVMHHLATLDTDGTPNPTKERPMNDTILDVRTEVPARRHELRMSRSSLNLVE